MAKSLTDAEISGLRNLTQYFPKDALGLPDSHYLRLVSGIIDAIGDSEAMLQAFKKGEEEEIPSLQDLESYITRDNRLIENNCRELRDFFKRSSAPQDVKTQLPALLNAVILANEKAKKDLLDYCTPVRKEKLAASQEMEKFIKILSELRESHQKIEKDHDLLPSDKKTIFSNLGKELSNQIQTLNDGLERKKFLDVVYTKGVIQHVATDWTERLTTYKDDNNRPDPEERSWVERALHALLKFLHINPNYQYKSTERREAQKAERVSFFAEAEKRLKPEDPETTPSVQATPKP